MSKNMFFKNKGPFKLNILFPKQSNSGIIKDIKSLDKAWKKDINFFELLLIKT